jgi:large conductance mechanosensitive channel
MIEEFKKFALRGNAVDLAIGVVIGAAFGAIVNSLVGDIMSPIIGAVTGGFDFSNYFLPLSSKVTATSLAEARKQGAVLAWGSFLTVVINFIIIAWVLFLVVKLMNRIMQSEATYDQAGDAAHGNPRLVEARAKVMRRAKTFEQRGCALSRWKPYAQRGVVQTR